MDDDRRPEGVASSTRSPAPQVSGSAGRIIDWTQSHETTAGDEELLVDVIGAFRQEAPVLVANIRQAVVARDAELLHRAAHTIKNAFYNLGAQTSGDVAFELEKAGKAGDFQRPSELLKVLEAEFRQVSQEIDRYMKEHGESAL